jgi:hypothetical protein
VSAVRRSELTRGVNRIASARRWRSGHARFASNCYRMIPCRELTRSAMSGHITIGGTWSPSAFAVLKLMMGSKSAAATSWPFSCYDGVRCYIALDGNFGRDCAGYCKRIATIALALKPVASFLMNGSR